MSGTPLAPVRVQSSRILACLRLGRVVLSTVVGGHAELIFERMRRRPGAERFWAAAEWTRRQSRNAIQYMDIEIEILGSVPSAPFLLAPNHTSYMDIPALGSACPLLFTPKADVADWPIIGAIARSSEQVFITRRKTRRLQTTLREITDRLAAGTSVCVFLEGTTTGGDRVLPFKPAFVQPAIEAGVPVVPVGIRWWSTDPAVNPAEDIAYWKDHHFPIHIGRLAGLRGIRARVKFGDPIASRTMERRELAVCVREKVVGLLADLDSTKI